MTSLIERIETATTEQQAAILIDAWDLLFKTFPDFQRWAIGTAAGRFGALIDAGAFIDAAVMLVPAMCAWSLDGGNPNCSDSASVEPLAQTGVNIVKRGTGEGDTPALALTAAILRARGMA